VVVIEGHADLITPAEKRCWQRTSLPEIRLIQPSNGGAARLLDVVRGMAAARATAVQPCDLLSLSAVIDARDVGMIVPVLVGRRARLAGVAAEGGWNWPAWPSRTYPTAMPRQSGRLSLASPARARFWSRAACRTTS